jgi:hypothetical protein
MPWRNPKTVPLTRIDVVSQIPSDSAIYAIMEDETCLLVGETWNLRGRLLELLNVLQDVGEFRVTYELCSEEERLARKAQVSAALVTSVPPAEMHTRELPGITFRDSISK